MFLLQLFLFLLCAVFSKQVFHPTPPTPFFPLNCLRALNCYIHNTLQMLVLNDFSKMKFLMSWQLSLVYWHYSGSTFLGQDPDCTNSTNMEWKSYLRKIISKYPYESMMYIHIICSRDACEFFTHICSSVLKVWNSSVCCLTHMLEIKYMSKVYSQLTR